MNCRVVKIGAEPYDVYIGRPDKWGNPFSTKDSTLAQFKVSSRKEEIEKHLPQLAVALGLASRVRKE